MSGTWWEYVEEHKGSDNASAIAKKAGVAGSQVTRWAQGSSPSVEAVRGFAAGYRRPVLEAFVAAGMLTRDDIRQQVRILDLDSLTNEALARAVLARMNQGSGHEKQEPGPEAGGAEHDGEGDDPGAPIAAADADPSPHERAKLRAERSRHGDPSDRMGSLE